MGGPTLAPILLHIELRQEHKAKDWERAILMQHKRYQAGDLGAQIWALSGIARAAGQADEVQVPATATIGTVHRVHGLVRSDLARWTISEVRNVGLAHDE